MDARLILPEGAIDLVICESVMRPAAGRRFWMQLGVAKGDRRRRSRRMERQGGATLRPDAGAGVSVAS